MTSPSQRTGKPCIRMTVFWEFSEAAPLLIAVNIIIIMADYGGTLIITVIYAKKWNYQSKFKFWMRQFEFPYILLLLRKALIQLRVGQIGFFSFSEAIQKENSLFKPGITSCPQQKSWININISGQ